MFTLNRKFRREYNRLFQKDPEAANLFLLLCELADEKGRVVTGTEELVQFFATRFENPEEYQL